MKILFPAVIEYLCTYGHNLLQMLILYLVSVCHQTNKKDELPVCERSSCLRTDVVAVISGTCVEAADDYESGYEFEQYYYTRIYKFRITS
jgi:hypothetical protein